MSEDLTLYRGEGGDPHLVAFRCAHRGTQLSTGWVEGDEIRCFYHGWKYDGAGQCTEQPAEPEPFCNRIKIRSYPVKEYLGLIFAYLGEGEAPEFPRLLDYEETEFPVDTSYAVWPCNYFTQLDNAVDPLHVSIAHWHFGAPTEKHLAAQEHEWGLKVGAGHFELPNAHEWGGAPNGSKGSWNYARGWRVPVDDQHHLRFGIEVVASTSGEGARRAALREQWAQRGMDASEAVLAGLESSKEQTPDRFPGPALTNVQDYIILVGLGDIAEQPNDEHLGRSDVGVVLLRKVFARELAALSEGRSLTSWVRPPRLWLDVEKEAALAEAGAR